MSEQKGRGRWFAWSAVCLAAGSVGLWLLRGDDDAALLRLVHRRAQLVVAGDSEGFNFGGLASTRIVALRDDGSLLRALAGDDGYLVARALGPPARAQLLVFHGARAAESVATANDGRAPNRHRTTSGGPAPSILGRLQRFESARGLRVRYLSPRVSLVEADDLAGLPAPLDEVLATVARAILAGHPAPPLSLFPEPLRRNRSVEVLVMLRDRGEPRLWRSARGNSLAQALLTAAPVARDRWKERQFSLGGSLRERLPLLDVEVVLLREDGTLGDAAVGFIDQVFQKDHGVAYEHRGAWRYRLPGERDASPVRAFEALFVEHGLRSDAWNRTDLRLYRLLTTSVARSPAGSPAVPPLPDSDDETEGRQPTV